jgi:hypothetical protein
MAEALSCRQFAVSIFTRRLKPKPQFDPLQAGMTRAFAPNVPREFFKSIFVTIDIPRIFRKYCNETFETLFYELSQSGNFRQMSQAKFQIDILQTLAGWELHHVLQQSLSNRYFQ